MQKKFLSGLVALTVLSAFFMPGKNIALAAAPQGTLTGSVITVNIGEIKAINTLTVTDFSTAEITAANDIRIQIPAGVNAVWDIADTTATLGGTASAKASATVSYPDTKTLLIDVTTNFANSDTLTLADLSLIGNTAATAATALNWSIDGGTTYGAGNANTAVTIADGTVDTLTSVSTALSSAVVSATGTSYTVSFTVPAGGVITKDGKIKVTFPAGFNVASAGAGALTGIDGTVVASVSGQDVTLTRQNDGTNSTAGAKSVVITGVVNHATATDTYTLTATTQTSASALLATAATSAFSINPAAVSNLTCEVSGQSDAVWLRWTVPTGATGGYEVKYQQGSSITYGSATTFSQTWSNGTVGTSQQQLLSGLSNTQYTFAIKAKGANTSISAVSNTPSCTLVTSSSSSILEKIAPTTQVTNPATNSTLPPNKPYTIKGTSLDKGGSSVKMVEVSIDNGTTWDMATIVNSDDENRIWEYVWKKPSPDTKKIMVRATDWVGNVETPVTINVTVAEKASGPIVVATTPAASVTPGTPAEKEALIANLKSQLVILLQKVIELLLAQIQSQTGR